MNFVLPGVLDSEPPPKSGPCSEVKLTPEQKAKLKAAYFKFAEEKINMEADVKKAHLSYEKVLTDNEANSSAAEKASQWIVNSAAKFTQSEQDYKNEMFFKILKPVQRSQAQACLDHMARDFFNETHAGFMDGPPGGPEKPEKPPTH
jgi:Spy/CpxP family protein refolding chaperone